MRGPLRLLVTVVLLALLTPSLVAAPAAAADDAVLADFETADALRGATILAPGVDSATVTDTFASTGRSAMSFDVGAMRSKDGLVFPRVNLAELDKIQLSTDRSVTPKRLLADDIRLTSGATDVPGEVARVARG